MAGVPISRAAGVWAAVRRSTAWSISAGTATITTTGRSLGCTGWGFDDVLPYFRRSERNLRHAGRQDDPWHGGEGPLHVSDLVTPNPFSRRFVEAACQAGLPLNPTSTVRSRKALACTR